MQSLIRQGHRPKIRISMACQRSLAIVLALALISVAAPHAARTEPASKTFVVVGKSRIQETGINTAKDRAIAECKQIAVEQMTAELLALDVLVQQFPAIDTVIFNQADKFIQYYKVLNENRKDDQYHVLVQAKVSGEMIEAALRAAGLLSAETRPATQLILSVVGSDNLSSFVLFRSTLNQMTGVEAVQISEILPNRTTLTVDYQGAAGDFAEALLRQPQEGYSIRVFQESDTTFRIDLASARTAQP